MMFNLLYSFTIICIKVFFYVVWYFQISSMPHESVRTVKLILEKVICDFLLVTR